MKRVKATREAVADALAYDRCCDERAYWKAQGDFNFVIRAKGKLRLVCLCFLRDNPFKKGREIEHWALDKRVGSATETYILRRVIEFAYAERLKRGSDLGLFRIIAKYFEAVVHSQWEYTKAARLKREPNEDPFKYTWLPKRPRSIAPYNHNRQKFFRYIADPSNFFVKRPEYWRPMLPHRFELQRERWVTQWKSWDKHKHEWEEIQGMVAEAMADQDRMDWVSNRLAETRTGDI